MYKIDKDKNRIAQLEVKQFTELGFSERAHLQEWLANEPAALGEELLIIQKEFDGFDDTRERLDLLAVDKEGNLVVIENKLDDTGRDVVWQVLKYASYCSSLTKPQIIEIYQQYLSRFCGGGNAQESLCDFLGLLDIEEAVLNRGNRQRVMFVAAKFRKEVTSTALWLLSNGIQLQCFKVTPFSMEGELFLSVDQIIPTPESKELMIGMSAKEAGEKSTEVVLKNRHKIRLEFWELALDAMKGSSCNLFDNISPGKQHWLNAGSGLRRCPYSLIFGKKECRVSISMERKQSVENKFVFDSLMKQKDDIENRFGDQLEWIRGENIRASGILFRKSFEGYNKENWPEMIKWMEDKMTCLEQAFKAPLSEVGSKLKAL